MTSARVENKMDDLTYRIRAEAFAALHEEPEMETLLYNTVLAPGVETFEDAVASAIAFRLVSSSSLSHVSMVMDSTKLVDIFRTAISSSTIEGGNLISCAIREDVMAVLERDPACTTVLEVLLFFKGFAALVTHRVARHRWMEAKSKSKTDTGNNNKASMVALFLQSQASAVFGVDIHPAATIGKGVMLDHGTGIVIGETAVMGDGCTLLHGVTLGGTGKDLGDRHPKIGKHVLIGAGASILGNIQVGDRCKIGAGSIVLRPIPEGATAVGAPAKIIGHTVEEKPASSMDRALKQVSFMRPSESVISFSDRTEDLTSDEEEEQYSDDDEEKYVATTTPPSSSSVSGLGGLLLCPFQAYYVLSKRAPPGTVTICMLVDWLRREGCSADEVGACFFAMDEGDHGYIEPDCFKAKGKDAILRFTSMTTERLDMVWDDFLAKIPVPMEEMS